jgi:hypothetical protein
MSRDGSGTYSLPESAFVFDTVISETAMNSNLSDIAAALTASLAKDGQTDPTANLPMNSKKLTGLAAGSAAGDSANLGQVQAQAYVWCGTATGTADAVVLTPSPAITAYAAGQHFRWIASANVNTGAATVAISGLATKAIENDGSALVAGDHAASKVYEGMYDGTAFQITRVMVGLPLAGGTMTGPINYANEDAITAGTTQTQAGATALTEEVNRVTVVGTDGDGVKLPAAAAGGRVTVRNADASEYLQVWPASSDAIDTGAVDAVDADPIGPGAWRTYVAKDGTTWEREAQKSEFYVGSFTRDLTLSAGNQTVSGPTFKPTSIIMLASTGAAGEGSIGVTDGVLDGMLRDNYGNTANTWSASTSRSVSLLTSASVYSQGYVTALLPRGWTFTWEKSGAPTGTATIAYIAIRS